MFFSWPRLSAVNINTHEDPVLFVNRCMPLILIMIILFLMSVWIRMWKFLLYFLQLMLFTLFAGDFNWRQDSGFFHVFGKFQSGPYTTSCPEYLECYLTSKNVRWCILALIILKLIITWTECANKQCPRKKKELGVIVSKHMKWGKQCSAVVLKANRTLGMIKRNFVNRTPEVILALYKGLVRPHLEYCSPVWNPHFTKDVKLLGVQRNCTNLVAHQISAGHRAQELQRKTVVFRVN